MAIGECELATPECPYYFKPSLSHGNQENGCFTDEDHIFGRAETGIGKEFTELECNKRQICRWEHDEINRTYVHLPLPDVEVMKQIIERERNVRKGTTGQ